MFIKVFLLTIPFHHCNIAHSWVPNITAVNIAKRMASNMTKNKTDARTSLVVVRNTNYNETKLNCNSRKFITHVDITSNYKTFSRI